MALVGEYTSLAFLLPAATFDRLRHRLPARPGLPHPLPLHPVSDPRHRCRIRATDPAAHAGHAPRRITMAPESDPGQAHFETALAPHRPCDGRAGRRGLRALCLFWRGWKWAVAYLLGAAASYLNFRWLKRVVDALGRRVGPRGPARSSPSSSASAMCCWARAPML
jgi:hypothetical protein